MLNIFNKKRNLSFIGVIYNNRKNNENPNFSRHYPPNIQEWPNSVYNYNKNNIKYIPVFDNTINNLIHSFFNMTFILKQKIKSAQRRILFKRVSTNKILISKAITNHTNDNILITIFTYNREQFFLNKKIKNLFYNIIRVKNPIKVFKDRSKLRTKGIALVKILNKKNINIKNLLLLFKDLNTMYSEYNYFMLKLENLYYYRKKMLQLNKYKFKDFFLLQLKTIINKYYNKNVEFKIINLKKLSLNTDIFLQAMIIKLKNRNNSIIRVMNKALRLVKPANFNKYKKLSLNKKKLFFDLINKYNLHDFLNKTFTYNRNKWKKKDKTEVLNNLKNKNVKGIKLQASGRLTKRMVAARSIIKVRYKGNLKNVDSSYKYLSTVVLKGNTNSDTQYTLINSATRNGSFGLKGWISNY